MELKEVLVLYKKSAYKIYFLEKRRPFSVKNKTIIQKELKSFKKSHDEHYATLKTVETVLSRYQIRFTKSYRSRNIDYTPYDLVITVGGDGTFLEAARNIKNGVLLGVNSSLSYSVGNFCVANRNNFETMLKQILRKNFKTSMFQRLRLEIDGCRKTINCLNDVLICHSNPAAMSRYILKIGSRKEEQRSSGIWIATPTGSSGAIQSAGGKILPHTARKIQYIPRELYGGGRWKYSLTGGVLSKRQSITVISLMRQGKVYIDGTHLEHSFSLGATIKMGLSPNPIKTVNL